MGLHEVNMLRPLAQYNLSNDVWVKLVNLYYPIWLYCSASFITSLEADQDSGNMYTVKKNIVIIQLIILTVKDLLEC